MPFIRVKKIKRWEYAYLVENRWKSGRTRQKVKKYLGKVCHLDNIVGLRFKKDVSGMDFGDAVGELVKFELMKNGFEEHGKKGKGIMKKGDFHVDLENGEFLSKGKPVVFESNEGFICQFTYERAVNFKACGNEEETGLRLAETILEAGISVPHSIFVKLFEKLHKTAMPDISDTQKFINSI
jgi:hypothetical protein